MTGWRSGHRDGGGQAGIGLPGENGLTGRIGLTGENGYPVSGGGQIALRIRRKSTCRRATSSGSVPVTTAGGKLPGAAGQPAWGIGQAA